MGEIACGQSFGEERSLAKTEADAFAGDGVDGAGGVADEGDVAGGYVAQAAGGGDGSALRTGGFRATQTPGHGREMELVIEAMKQGKDAPIPFDELVEVTEATFAIDEAIRTQGMVRLDRPAGYQFEDLEEENVDPSAPELKVEESGKNEPSVPIEKH